MFKRMLPWLIMIFVVITIIAVTAILLWSFLLPDTGRTSNGAVAGSAGNIEGTRLPAAKVKALSVEINDVLTNLKTGEFIKVSFTFELNNDNGREEFMLLDFKIKALIINTLSDLTPEEVTGSTGKDFISSTLINEINKVLQEGKVREVNITDFVLS